MTDSITDPDILPTEDTPFTEADDCYHPPVSDDRYLVETTWWSLNVPELRLGAWLHSQYHVNLGTCTWRVFARDRARRILTNLPITGSWSRRRCPPNPTCETSRSPVVVSR